MHWLDLSNGERGDYKTAWTYRLKTRDPVDYRYAKQTKLGPFIGWGPRSTQLWFRTLPGELTADEIAPGASKPARTFPPPKGYDWSRAQNGCRLLRDVEDDAPALLDLGTLKPVPLPEKLPAASRWACSRPLSRAAVFDEKAPDALLILEVTRSGATPLRTLALKGVRAVRWATPDWLVVEDAQGLSVYNAATFKRRALSKNGHLENR